MDAMKRERMIRQWEQRARRICLPWALLAALVLLWLANPSRGQDIRIWPTASVHDDMVRLRDVASISDASTDVAARLGDTVVRPAASPSGDVLVTLDDVRTALSDAGFNLASVRLFGATNCVVRRPTEPSKPPVRPKPVPLAARSKSSGMSKTVTDGGTLRGAGRGSAPAAQPLRVSTTSTEAIRPDSLEFAVRQFIQSRAGCDRGRVSIRFSLAAREALRIAGPDLRFDVRTRDTDCLGLVALDVDVLSGEARPRTVNLLVEVSLTRPVVVARRTINQGRVLTGHDVGLDERTFQRKDDIGLTEVSGAIGQEARAFLREGDTIGPQQLRVAPLVRRGELVTVWSRRGGLVVKSAGRAAADGALGDVVRVKTESGAEPFEATVTGPKTVSVQASAEQVATAR